MTVTKQQQLEWLAKNLEKWNSGYNFAVVDKCSDGGFYVRWPSVCSSGITKKEWQQERDKMQKKAELVAQPAQDNSWHERGEFPPVGCECEVFVSDENKWLHFDVIAIRDGHVLGWCREGSCGFQSNDKSNFRPLRTERDKAIDEMVCEFINYYGDPKGGERYLGIAEKLYDAGYRKEVK